MYSNTGFGLGKIRYISGWCIAKLKHRKMKMVKKRLFSKQKKTRCNFVKAQTQISLLEQLETSSQDLESNSKYADSLQHTKSKQNIRHSLTNVTDPTFEFFLHLDKEVRVQETAKNLTLHGEDFYDLMFSNLRANTNLRAHWIGLFKLGHTDDDSDEEASSVALRLGQTEHLFEEVLRKFIKMSSASFRKEFLRDMKITHKEAHRKQIRIAGGKKVCNNLAKKSSHNKQTAKKTDDKKKHKQNKIGKATGRGEKKAKIAYPCSVCD